jgi:hypothetical protein
VHGGDDGAEVSRGIEGVGDVVEKEIEGMVGDRGVRNGDAGGSDAAARRGIVGRVPDAARKVAVKSRDVREKFAQPGGVNVLLRGAGVQDDGNGVHHAPLAGEGVGVDSDEIRHGV